eukprot:TRINITY_DN94827_c0_g1_i1.p2 TRINITY_DN94827_c0_g1~~TRINITY_DN94827_c0_g1_i1.p2  ORF type:complete len:126 (-),score=14.20 TRINITY_DN94827_c0_g1_i1:67-444(-)
MATRREQESPAVMPAASASDQAPNDEAEEEEEEVTTLAELVWAVSNASSALPSSTPWSTATQPKAALLFQKSALLNLADRHCPTNFNQYQLWVTVSLFITDCLTAQWALQEFWNIGRETDQAKIL